MAYKIDSNVTGLRYAEEADLKTLPGSPVWYPLEPNKYSNFGGKLSTVARKPISQTRQQQKGTVTDLEASGGFEQDLTQNNTLRLLQGFMFADAYEPATTKPLNSAAVDLGAVDGAAHTIAAAAGLDIFAAGNLVTTEGFGVAANNGGVHVVSSAVAGLLTLSAGLATEANAPATARVDLCGHQFAVGDLTIVMVGGLPRLTSAAVDFTTAFPKLTVGSWIYVGGDATGLRFSTGHGFARIRSIAATYLELDKADWTAVADDGTTTNAGGAGLTVQIFFGTTVKNESDAAKIKRRTYQLERTLGSDANGVMSEYLVGACANEFTLNVKQADKVTTDLSFMALDNEQRDGTTGVKSGDRPSLTAKDAFNTSSDFSRIKLSLVSDSNPNPTALFAYCTDISLKINNNVTAVKAIGVLGGFDTNAGMFVVDGKLTAYFADIASVQAVRDNKDVTIDIAMVKKNAGFVFDIPLITLGDGQAKVEADKAIELPLDLQGAQHPVLGHTMAIVAFPYLPTLAE